MFDLVLRGQGSAFRQAKAQNPTFLTVWIGNNDILGYATEGGTKPYTPVANFTAIYNQLADSIASLNSKVVVANIPNVTTIPFFTTVGGQLMLAGVTKVWAQRSDNSIAYVSLTQNMLTLKASELMYDASGNPTGIGMVSSKPFPNAVVLDSGEVGTALSIISQYNSVIAAAATAKGFELVNVNTIFNQYADATQSAAGGIMVDGILFSVVFVKGNLFSLDGVHPSNQGHAILANEFISKINAKWGAAIPRINVANVPGGFVFGKELKISNIGIPIFPKGALDHLLF
jgi:lysophospholipase L1-like esterase